MEKQKTIFITSFFGLISRNILATDFLDILKSDNNLNVLILVPLDKLDLYRKKFNFPRVSFEGCELKKSLCFWDRFLSAVFLNFSDTQTKRIHRLVELKNGGGYIRFFYHWCLNKISVFKCLRTLLRGMDFLLLSPSDNFSSRLFDKYKPLLVFATDIFELGDIIVAREAKKRGVEVVGMVRSWDNITSKGLNRFIPCNLAVNTPDIKKEAIKYLDVQDDKIDIVGIPHYDVYLNEKRVSKESLFNRLGLDVKKKTIFFAPPSVIYSGDDPIAEAVVGALKNLDAQILLRLYMVGDANLGSIKPIYGKIAIDRPTAGKDFTSADLTAEGSHLADLIYHSDVVISFASTLAVDALLFDKPVVFVGFDAESKPYWRSLRRFYDYDHQRLIIESNGIKLVRNPTEMLELVNGYISNPELDASDRQRIKEQRCWKLDGKSGERLANFILNRV